MKISIRSIVSHQNSCQQELEWLSGAAPEGGTLLVAGGCTTTLGCTCCTTCA